MRALPTLHVLRSVAAIGLVCVLCTLGGNACSRFGPVYPPRPSAAKAAPLADPAPARIVVHLAVTSAALKGALEQSLPRIGDGSFALLGAQRRYRWERGPVEIAFARGLVVVTARVRANLPMPLGSLDFPLDLEVKAEPVVNTVYTVKLQSADVRVTSSDHRLKIADHVAGVLDTIAGQIATRVRDFSQDLRPMLEEAYTRVATPLELPIGDAKGCAELAVLGIEAGPTIVADGIEKDFAVVVAPSVTLPCAAEVKARPLPALANVATLAPGPFTVTVPIAARYEELTKAMGMAFTDGKYFFSADYPKLYLEHPEVYESQGQLVLKLHLHGPVRAAGIDADLDGDLFLSGHPQVVDNELTIPDLEPTIETSNFLLSLKAMTDGARIRDQARSALRLDIGERLRAVRAKLSTDLTFGSPQACFRGDVDKVEVTGVHAHAGYLRVLVAITARAQAAMPCPFATTAT